LGVLVFISPLPFDDDIGHKSSTCPDRDTCKKDIRSSGLLHVSYRHEDQSKCQSSKNKTCLNYVLDLGVTFLTCRIRENLWIVRGGSH